ncbi:hypothetical protein N5853_09470 [Bartonella sp. HY329]|nr:MULTISPECIES: hypothetical protein [unclassified Bartonella]UXM94336.1 hypothetical protein N5853_09470 [Bartonella sp. HY329]UXN08659.1 hypothetical protein N5852_09480 [Bartonella sp. HY328]
MSLPNWSKPSRNSPNGSLQPTALGQNKSAGNNATLPPTTKNNAKDHNNE